MSSRIVLTQTFYNPSDKPTGRAKYVFPLPSNAAVCAFELELEDGQVIVGEIKEKEEAAQTFTHAVEQGKVVALVERVTDDSKHYLPCIDCRSRCIPCRTVFTISVGSIPATTRVMARLTVCIPFIAILLEQLTSCMKFVMDIMHEALTDHIRLQLPMYIAERYGSPPAAILDASTADSRTRVHINVDVQTSEVIYAIRSPTHRIVLRHYKGRSGRISQRRMSAVWQSLEFLSSDFVIIIQAEGLDKPRCFAEVLHVETEDSQEFTVAMQLTLVPKFQTPKIPSQEYIFVIDRSGSMEYENKIETAKKTLTMLLRLLPSTQTTFNIFSFGSQVDGLWEHSRLLNPTSLVEAVRFLRPKKQSILSLVTDIACHFYECQLWWNRNS